MPEATSGAAAVLTDGTGVSPFTPVKVIKDLVYDSITGAIAGIAATGATGVQDTLNVPLPVVFAIANAVVAAVVRAVLRWAST